MFEGFFKQYITPKNILFIIGIILITITLFKLPEITLLFFASFVIACSLEPAVKKLSSKISKKAACAIVLIGAMLIVCAFFVPVIIIGTHEIKSFAASLPQYAENIKTLPAAAKITDSLNIDHIDISSVFTSASGAVSGIFSKTINAGKNIGSALVYLLISILLIYYFMLDKNIVKSAVLRLFPRNLRNKTGAVFDAISQRCGGYITAQLVTMASVGIIISAGLFLIKSEYALLLGVISALFDIVPIAGPAAAFVICMLAASKSGAAAMALTAVIFFAAQIVENNFVRPYVFGRFLNLHPLIIYLFILIAAKYSGAIGVIFAPAIAAAFVILVEEIYMKNMD